MMESPVRQRWYRAPPRGVRDQSGLSQRGSSRSQHQDADRRPGPDGTSERIRDKIEASKRKGLWVGVMVPLGYVSRDEKLLIVEGEAERVRTIFQRYLDLADE